MPSDADASRHILLLNWRDTQNPEGGGSEVFVERVAAEMAARGHRCTLICAAVSGAPAQERLASGVNVLRRGGRHAVFLKAALTYLGGAIGLGPLARGSLGRPDVIIDVGNGMPFLSKLYARKPVVVLVHHVHREQWPVVMGPIKARLGWWIESRLAVRLYRACRYVTVSQATRAELASLGVDQSRISVVHNGTPELPRRSFERDPYPSLLVLGRLVPHKRVEIALEAVARLSAELPGLRLTVAGNGWWEPQLREMAERLGITDRVDFAGFVSQERKQELLARAWVALTPSLKEGWGLTIVEAASQGTPAVAFAAAGGVGEALLDGETGLLAGNEADFIGLVRQLLHDPAKREQMGEAARAHAESFTWRAAGESFCEIVATATAQTQPKPALAATTVTQP